MLTRGVNVIIMTYLDPNRVLPHVYEAAVIPDRSGQSYWMTDQGCLVTDQMGSDSYLNCYLYPRDGGVAGDLNKSLQVHLMSFLEY